MGNRFVISFDDGSTCFELRSSKVKRAWVCRHSVSLANRLGQRNEWDLGVDTTTERLMIETQVQEWLSLGFEIGAHTSTHPRLSAIPISEADPLSELCRSKMG